MLPQVIVLNGASSSGKTGIARALQELLPAVYLNLSIDTILYALPGSDLVRMIDGTQITRAEYRYDKLVLGHHAAAAGMLECGNRLILDNAITRPEWKVDLEERLRPFRAFWVGVDCDPVVLRERELRRSDRAIGTAEREAALVHVGGRYDFMVDTTSASSPSCAEQVISSIQHC